MVHKSLKLLVILTTLSFLMLNLTCSEETPTERSEEDDVEGEYRFFLPQLIVNLNNKSGLPTFTYSAEVSGYQKTSGYGIETTRTPQWITWPSPETYSTGSLPVTALFRIELTVTSDIIYSDINETRDVTLTSQYIENYEEGVGYPDKYTIVTIDINLNNYD